MITHCISTYNNLEYLKIAVESVKKNSYYKDAPFIIHAENCTDGTDEWLMSNAEKYGITPFVEHNNDPRGIGGGMNYCANLVKTDYINFLHSDFYVTQNWDLELMKVHLDNKGKKLWVNSFRVEPNMFNGEDRPGTHFVPCSAFGEYYYNFDSESFERYAQQLASMNSFIIPKGEGVSGMVLKKVWDETGGNDMRFAPTSWEDMDLFLRMKINGVQFMMPTKSVVWHFGARGSHRLEENNGKSSERQVKYERINGEKFIEKWGGYPVFDQYGMIDSIKKLT